MSIADMIPKLDDAELANLLANARRLQTGSGASQSKAEALIPLVEAELAGRAARAPKPAAKPRAKPRAKAAPKVAVSA